MPKSRGLCQWERRHATNPLSTNVTTLRYTAGHAITECKTGENRTLVLGRSPIRLISTNPVSYSNPKIPSNYFDFFLNSIGIKAAAAVNSVECHGAHNLSLQLNIKQETADGRHPLDEIRRHCYKTCLKDSCKSYYYYAVINRSCWQGAGGAQSRLWLRHRHRHCARLISPYRYEKWCWWRRRCCPTIAACQRLHYIKWQGKQPTVDSHCCDALNGRARFTLSRFHDSSFLEKRMGGGGVFLYLFFLNFPLETHPSKTFKKKVYFPFFFIIFYFLLKRRGELEI